MEPESNQQSSTAFSRFITLPHTGQSTSTRSMYGLCSSISSGQLRLMALSSARLPITCVCPHAHVHTGSGVPQ